MKFILWNFLLRLKHPSCSIQKAQIAKCLNLENNVTFKSGCVVGSDIIGKYTFINHYCLIDKNVKDHRISEVALKHVKKNVKISRVPWKK